ncbi:MAG: hypothetical protein E6Y10_02575, partial [Anaerococcus sp.]|nr:hypothetical protein [Anaerococcus sp.]
EQDEKIKAKAKKVPINFLFFFIKSPHHNQSYLLYIKDIFSSITKYFHKKFPDFSKNYNF